MKKAIFMGIIHVREDVDARVFQVSPPLGGYEFVKVSAKSFKGFNETFKTYGAIDMDFPPETYIFGCKADGQIIDYGELEGSYRGGVSHAEALRNAGYEVVSDGESIE